MKRFKGTKGKWRSGEDMTICDENGFEIAGVAYPFRVKENWDEIAPHWGGRKNKGITYVDVSDEETIANAQLIATAPELLEALIKIVEENKNSSIISATSIAISKSEQIINKALGQ